MESHRIHGSIDPSRREVTEWEEILVKHDIIQEDPYVKARKDGLQQAKQQTEVEKPSFALKVRQTQTTEELDRLEDDGKTDDDEVILAKIRESRLNDLRQQQVLNRFGFVEHIGRDEFLQQVTKYSAEGGIQGGPQWVIIELIQDKLERSLMFSQIVNQVAKSNPATKFVRMVADQCIENWPDSNVPSVFAYFGGDLQSQLIGVTNCEMYFKSELIKIGAIVRDDGRNDRNSDGGDDEDVTNIKFETKVLVKSTRSREVMED